MILLPDFLMKSHNNTRITQLTLIVTSGVEIVQITPFGIWIDIAGEEYYLDHESFPWLRNATIEDIWDVELDRNGNLHWPKLDIDIEIDSLRNPEAYPLLYK